MASDSLRALLDSLGTVTDAERTRLQALDAATQRTKNTTGLRFAAGDEVLDLATGSTGKVMSASRADGSREEVYTIYLNNLTLVWRGVNELEPAPRSLGASRS